MSHVPLDRSRFRLSLRTLRLPLLGVVGALSMGSGWGNPGCDSSCLGSGGDGYEPGEPYKPPPCDAACEALAGRYRLTFTDTRPLGAGCEKIGVTLPTELVLARQGDDLTTTTAQGLVLTGTYYKEPTHDLYLTGSGTVRNVEQQQQHEVSIVISGNFVQVPATAQEVSSFKGDYFISRLGSIGEPEGTPQCDIGRAFSASR